MWYAIIIVTVLIADQLSKAAVVSAFQLFESKEIIPGMLNLVYVTNTGAAFSMFADMSSPWREYFFYGIGVIAVIGLTVAHFKLKTINRFYCFPLALIAGGAVGNLIDRVRHGAVIDFLDLYYRGVHWPAFNVADSAICVGAVFFIVLNISDARKQNLSEAK